MKSIILVSFIYLKNSPLRKLLPARKANDKIYFTYPNIFLRTSASVLSATLFAISAP